MSVYQRLECVKKMGDILMSQDKRKKITIFYSSDEIVAAKRALWAECDTLLGTYPDRKTSDKRPAIIPHIDDIV